MEKVVVEIHTYRKQNEVAKQTVNPLTALNIDYVVRYFNRWILTGRSKYWHVRLTSVENGAFASSLSILKFTLTLTSKSWKLHWTIHVKNPMIKGYLYPITLAFIPLLVLWNSNNFSGETERLKSSKFYFNIFVFLLFPLHLKSYSLRVRQFLDTTHLYKLILHEVNDVSVISFKC